MDENDLKGAEEEPAPLCMSRNMRKLSLEKNQLWKLPVSQSVRESCR